MQGLGIVIGLQIGSGIFASPNQIHLYAGSYGASLAVWITSGLLAWCGAACYSELGSALPLNGGTGAYLGRIFGNFAGYLYYWTALTVLKPGSSAIIAIILGEYLNAHVVWRRVISLSALTLTAVINYFGSGPSAGTYFLALKFLLLAGVTALGFVLGRKGSTSDDDTNGGGIWAGTKSVGSLITALFGGIWAYDGWDNLNFLAGDMRNPTRDLPRVISTAMISVIVAYFVVNCGYFVALSGPALDSSPSVALTMAQLTGSTIVSWIVRGGIALSCAGALNAATLSAVKLTQVAAENKFIPQALKQEHWALVLQFVLTGMYVCVGDFGSLLPFYGSAGYLFYAAAVVGLLWLRYTEPTLPRPYKVWLVAPLVFITLAVTILVRTTLAHPISTLLIVVFIGSGSPWYYFYVAEKS